uniref:(northern house mosquito) hypothetical protein n=1 Tax=Culex pipiens TaxID=7175 RepID=A0A8D7ZYW1_CULPI
MWPFRTHRATKWPTRFAPWRKVSPKESSSKTTLTKSCSPGACTRSTEPTRTSSCEHPARCGSATFSPGSPSRPSFTSPKRSGRTLTCGSCLGRCFTTSGATGSWEPEANVRSKRVRVKAV